MFTTTYIYIYIHTSKEHMCDIHVVKGLRALGSGLWELGD